MDTKEIAVVRTQATKALTAASAVVITDDPSMLEAGEIRKKIKTVGKMIKEKKEEITKPLNEALKNVRAMFAPVEADCEQAAGVIESKMLDYQRKVARERVKIEQEAQKKLEEAQTKLEAGNLTERQMERVEAKVEQKLEAAPEVISKSDAFHTRTVKKVEIFGMPERVDRYWVLDEVLVRKDALAGVVIEGVRVVEEKILV